MNTDAPAQPSSDSPDPSRVEQLLTLMEQLLGLQRRIVQDMKAIPLCTIQAEQLLKSMEEGAADLRARFGYEYEISFDLDQRPAG